MTTTKVKNFGNTERDIEHEEKFMKYMRNVNFPFPSSYIVLDTETNGLNIREDNIVQFGHLEVVDGNMCKPVSIMLDWTKYPLMDQDRLKWKMAYCKKDIENQGGRYRFNYDMLRDGVDPIKVLDTYYKHFVDYQANGGYFLAHNGFRYDIPLIESHFRRYLNKDFKFDTNHLIDTGVLEKAVQNNHAIYKGETLEHYYYFVMEKTRSKGVYWNLSNHCVTKYNLVKENNLDMTNAHTADFDCLVAHLLFEQFRISSYV